MAFIPTTTQDLVVIILMLVCFAASLRERAYSRALHLPPRDLSRNLTIVKPAKWSSRDWDPVRHPALDLANLTSFIAHEARLTRHHCLTAAQVGVPLRVVVFSSPSAEPLVNPQIVRSANTTRLGRYKREEDGEIEIVPVATSVDVAYLGKYLSPRIVTLESKDAECFLIAYHKFI